ncbi:hypothetical protein V2J09_024352 [Rumex salicifolius]
MWMWWWGLERRLVDVLMSGNGRCQRLRNMLGRGADGGCDTEEKPGPLLKVPVSSVPAPIPPTTGLLDSGYPICSAANFYSQALKALSDRSPFDSAEVLATTVPTLPSGLGSGLLARQSEGRKRHKKSHAESKSSKKGSIERRKRSSIWADYEEYFRELVASDIDMLHKWSTSFDLLVSDTCLSIPVLGNVVRNQSDSEIVSDAPSNVAKLKTCVNDPSIHEETVTNAEEDQPMEIDDTDGNSLPPVAHESFSPQQHLHSLSSLEWVLGSRNKVLLNTEWPTKKRKHLGGNAGLQRLVVAKSCKGKSRVCHFCSVGDTGNQLNQLVVCSSCDMRVHQKCYGIQGNVDESWKCSWCIRKNDAEAGGVYCEKGPCVLCPTSGGALKPVQGFDSGNDLSMEFAHLFCGLWMPEVYVDDMKVMEPILDVGRIKDTRKKLICYLCKVRQGTCVRCTDGSCRTSFHPICAREAGHRLEIWGKLGCDDVELRAFCSKHSHDFDEQGQSIAGIGSTSPTSELYELPLIDKPPEVDVGGKRKDQIADCLEELDDQSNKSSDAELERETVGINLISQRRVEHTDLANFTDKEIQEGSMCEVFVSPDSMNLPSVLKKLVDGEKVSLKDLGSQIGISPDSLAASLADNHFRSDLHCKLMKWLGDHAFIETSQKKLTVKMSVTSKVGSGGEDGSHSSSIKDPDTLDVSVNSVLPRRRTISSIRGVNDKNELSNIKDPNFENGEATPMIREKPTVMEKVAVVENIELQDSSAPTSPISRSIPSEFLKHGDHGSVDNEIVYSASADMAVGVPVYSATDEDCPDGMNIEPDSYIHLFFQKKIVEIQSGFIKKSCIDSIGPVDMNSSLLNQSSTNGICSKRYDQDVSNVDVIDGGKEVALDDLIKAKEKGILDLHPEDELEGELIYIQNLLFGHAAKRKCLSDNLICKIVKNLQQELHMVRKQRWDSVLVHQYLHELREAKKQGRKERKFKEAQEILAAATAAAAASSRTSLRKDSVDEASHQQDKLNVLTPRGRVGPPFLAIPRVKETTSSLAVSRNMFDKHLDSLQISAPVSTEHPRVCDICGRSETILNPILICSSCKVAVHLLCYRNVKESAGPWYCEHCDNSLAKGSTVQGANSSDNPNTITKCSLCGTSNGAFRKTSGSQWVHALCAEWVFESTYRRGQATPIAGMSRNSWIQESVVRGNDVCSICHERFGVCLKCNFGQCQSTFHPSCARSAGYYMSVRSVGGKQQRRAYCEKHSIEQRAKVEGQKHGFEELKSLKQVRVELEKLRLICERIVKREKLKRELVLCSHDLLASKKDTLAFSPLFQSPFFPPEASSESATTSIKGQTDCSLSCSTIQKSDEVTVDSTVSGKRRINLVVSADNDNRTEDSSTSQQQLPTSKPTERVLFAGKHLPLRASLTRRNIQETGGKKLKSLKHTETFEKELVMTSDQASVKNQRLPKGYIYVPMDRLSTEEQTGQDSVLLIQPTCIVPAMGSSSSIDGHSVWFYYMCLLILCKAGDSSTAPVAAACSNPSVSLWTSLTGPDEILTVAGLKSLFPRRNPRRISCITIPALNSLHSSLAMASCI